MVGKFLLSKGLPGCSICPGCSGIQYSLIQNDCRVFFAKFVLFAALVIQRNFRTPTNQCLASLCQVDSPTKVSESRAQKHQVALKRTAVSHERLLAVLLGSSAKMGADRSFVPLENQGLCVCNATSHLLYSTLYLVQGQLFYFTKKFLPAIQPKYFCLCSSAKSNLVSHTALFIELIKFFCIAEDMQF